MWSVAWAQGGGICATLFIFSEIWLTPLLLPPNIIFFPSSNVFWNVFLIIQVYFYDSGTYTFYLPSLHGEKYMGNYWKQWLLWVPLNIIVRIDCGHVLECNFGFLMHSACGKRWQVSTQPPEHPSPPSLAHPITFGAPFLNSGSGSLVLSFYHIPATPGLNESWLSDSFVSTSFF